MRFREELDKLGFLIEGGSVVNFKLEESLRVLGVFLEDHGIFKLEESLRVLGVFLEDHGIDITVGPATLSFTHASFFTHASLRMKNAEIKCDGGTKVMVCGRRMKDRASGDQEFDICEPDSFQEILELVSSDEPQQ